jgi:hypothetical protein
LEETPEADFFEFLDGYYEEANGERTFVRDDYKVGRIGKLKGMIEGAVAKNPDTMKIMHNYPCSYKGREGSHAEKGFGGKCMLGGLDAFCEQVYIDVREMIEGTCVLFVFVLSLRVCVQPCILLKTVTERQWKWS